MFIVSSHIAGARVVTGISVCMHAASSRITGVRLAIGIGECTVRGSMTGRAGQGRQWQAPKSEFCELDANSLKSAEQPRQDSGQDPGQGRAGRPNLNLAN